ncbi:uncharacterized protein LOC18421991 [Amborella trichopoda]|uniref:3-hydroxyacyl-[acyl-carrier-protein] dehydratase n=1 Tax=Amborella trichopoda TaxID=13333 RepID=W1NEN6_AMBTC|nr:uncharacterized protein LOC18421991 [Amborella trichopoda]ERM94217.1 hypothetical protein AMTR_s00010p00201890 [Amborella trichopoda]|eukprot:XP_006826980.1 uncharacterized protein LOC18421991 [Amborella trichopoda]
MEATTMAKSILSLTPHFPSSSAPHRTPQGLSPLILNRKTSSLLSLSKPSDRVLAIGIKGSNQMQNFAVHSNPDGAVAAEEQIPIEKQFPAYPSVLDINQIRAILPHRFPFLLVDRVIEYKPGVSAVGIKNVTINDNFFPGHFPDRPIMPGVLMVEAMAQVGGLVMLQPEVGGSKENFFFAGIDKVRFRKPVIAGDTLVMRMTLVKLQKRFGIAKMEGKAYVGGEVVCEGEFLMATGTE